MNPSFHNWNPTGAMTPESPGTIPSPYSTQQLISSCLFFIFTYFILCGCVGTPCPACEGQESALPSHHVVPETVFRLSGLAASTSLPPPRQTLCPFLPLLASLNLLIYWKYTFLEEISPAVTPAVSKPDTVTVTTLLHMHTHSLTTRTYGQRQQNTCPQTYYRYLTNKSSFPSTSLKSGHKVIFSFLSP